jgi:hypothetical protein
MRGVCELALKLRGDREGPMGKRYQVIKIANRTWENRLSGMKRGACGNVGDGGFIPPKTARAAFLSQLNLIRALVRNVGICRSDDKGETQSGGSTRVRVPVRSTGAE